VRVVAHHRNSNFIFFLVVIWKHESLAIEILSALSDRHFSYFLQELLQCSIAFDLRHQNDALVEIVLRLLSIERIIKVVAENNFFLVKHRFLGPKHSSDSLEQLLSIFLWILDDGSYPTVDWVDFEIKSPEVIHWV
jgi:hypothetical protein